MFSCFWFYPKKCYKNIWMKSVTRNVIPVLRSRGFFQQLQLELGERTVIQPDQIVIIVL